ncbi:Protein of unknown function [Sphingomonas gellani]|uniref:DUF3429 domain-containing protein n=1 Tax=Sphingomonas gellani TaxID=1166340 RepID=A0A1H8B5V1_9SPHN|nr:DUF3429 domain-containing protein [Sphingomonas gellani]SEM77524.1 Protein of unknown function [Sphingomonas gellani]
MGSPRVDTPERTQPLELLLGYGPACVIALLAGMAWAGIPYAAEATRIWGAAILIFLAGVTRGLSFFTEGGARWGQLAAMALRFWCGIAALVLPAVIGVALLILGYASIAAYDPVAARGGTAPRFFAHLRPWQMAIAVAGLVALEVLLLR